MGRCGECKIWSASLLNHQFLLNASCQTSKRGCVWSEGQALSWDIARDQRLKGNWDLVEYHTWVLTDINNCVGEPHGFGTSSHCDRPKGCPEHSGIKTVNEFQVKRKRRNGWLLSSFHDSVGARSIYIWWGSYPFLRLTSICRRISALSRHGSETIIRTGCTVLNTECSCVLRGSTKPLWCPSLEKDAWGLIPS